MQEQADIELLRQYAEQNSEAAFAELVTRYVNLVYSAAARKTGNLHAAEEITQAVFIILAKKAGSLREGTILSGWLYQTTRLTAANFLRHEIRRGQREQEAYMQSMSNETDAWPEIAPLLEDAMDRLNEKERNAIVLRFFEGRSFQEIGAEINGSENAAKKRVIRGLEKLRKFFTRRGVSSTTMIIGGEISAHSIQAAPAVLAKSVTVVAVAKGAVANGSILLLVTKTMKAITWLKMRFAVGTGAVMLLAVGVAIVAHSQAGDGAQTAREIAKQSEDAYAALTSYSDTGKVVTSGGGTSTETTFSIRLQRPNHLRVEWTQTGGFYRSKGLLWGDGTANYFAMDAADKFDAAKAEKISDLQIAIGMATGVSSSAASDIPGTFFKLPWGDQLTSMSRLNSTAQRSPNEKIGDADCHVITATLAPIQLPKNGGTSGTITTRLWIGKQDHLIHQVQTTSEGASTNPKITDDAAKVQLERQGKPVTPEAIAAMRAEVEKSIETSKGQKIVFLQTHENISVNQNFTAADFAR